MSNARQMTLGKLIRDLRKSAKVTVQQAATHLDCSVAKIGHWERGLYKTNRSELADLLAMYGVDEETRERAENLRREAAKTQKDSEWWDPFDLPKWFSPFVGLEQEAIEVFTFELGIIPGLLQTRDYAREIHKAGRMTFGEGQIEDLVELRARRQERLSDDDPLVVRAVIAEEALHRLWGDAGVMSEQLDALLKHAERDNVVIRVLPFAAGAHLSPQGSFAVLRFPANTADMAFIDTPLSGRIVDNSRDTSELSRMFSELQHSALSADESLALVRTLSDGFRCRQ